MTVKTLIGLALLATLLAGCGERIESFGGPTMGSRYEIKYVAEPGGAARAELRQAVESILAEVDAQMSTYRADSWVSRFNQLGGGSCMPAPAPVLELLRFGARLSRDSGGAFDLTVEPLMNLWGFGPQSRGERVPGVQEIERARAQVGHGHLRLEGDQVCKDVAVQLDFDSIAAGQTVDRIAQRLESLRVRRYLVDITGELRARGRKPDGEPWRVAVESPREDRQEAERLLALDGQGVSTSGDYRNYFERDGQRYSHTFDPRSGAPVRHELASVTVVAASALEADGLSTLLMVLGPRQGAAFAEARGIAAMFVKRAGKDLVVSATPAFEALEVR